MIDPDWPAKLGFTEETETNDAIRISVFAKAMVSPHGVFGPTPVIKIVATSNGFQFDQLTLDIDAAKELIAQIARAL